MSPSKQYSSDNNYSRESNYSDGSKYKSDSQWVQRDSYQQVDIIIFVILFISNPHLLFLYQDHRGPHQSYRERDLPLRTRNDHVQRSRTPPNTYRDSYDQNQSQKPPRSINPVPRGINRPPPKRISESSERGSREISPKRNKPTSNRNLQEVRRVDTIDKTIGEKKVGFLS